MKKVKQNSLVRNLFLATAIVGIELSITAPAFAHHPLGGKIPANFFEGIMSGFGHPIIGFDHFAFIVACGLIAVGIAKGLLIPVIFVLKTTIGTGFHLLSIDLPIPEIVIASSVILFGVLLAIRKRKQNISSTYRFIIIGLAAIAGIFHGHAYGEGIFGAEPTPLIAYLIGFTLIQLAIATCVYLLAQKISFKYLMRFAGSAIAAIGILFLY
jgi:urease accessory protein